MSGDKRRHSYIIEPGSIVIAADDRSGQMHFLRLEHPGLDG